MKNLIRRILKENEESSEFSWVDDIIRDYDYSNLSPGQLWYRANYGPIKTLKKTIMTEIATDFNDIEVRGDKIILIAKDGFCDLKDLFTDRENVVQYGRVNSWLVEKMTCDDIDYWEPYSDTYGKWLSDIWKDAVLPNKNLYEHILEHIKKEYVVPDNYNPKQLDIFGELPKKRELYYLEDLMSGNRERLLDEEYFNWLKEHPNELGKLIDDEDDFLELKRELSWAYDEAYNVAARDEIYESIKDEITDNFGLGEWSKFTLKNGKEAQVLKFDITDVFEATINEYFENCFSWCLSGNENVDNPEEYCDSCHDFDYYSFKNFYSKMLDDSDGKWSPRFNEYPSSSEVIVYFADSVYSRF